MPASTAQLQIQTAFIAGLLTLCTIVGSLRAVAAANSSVKIPPCPSLCNEPGQPPEQCREWEESGVCFIERGNSQISADASRTEIISVNSVVPEGSIRTYSLAENPIASVAITVHLVKGEKSSATIGLLSVGLEDGELFEGGTDVGSQNAMPVRYETRHTLSWSGEGEVPRGRKLKITVHEQDVFIESISIYQELR